MTHLILIRHSESRPDPDTPARRWQLTEAGRARCLHLADHLRGHALTRLASSDEPKAIRTAELLAAALSITAPLIIEPDFGETRRESAPFYADKADFRAAIHAAMRQPDQCIYGEESFTAARLRLTAALQRLASHHPHETLGIVTHGTIMSLLIAHSADRSAPEIWESLGMPAYAILTPTFQLVRLIPSIDGETARPISKRADYPIHW